MNFLSYIKKYASLNLVGAALIAFIIFWAGMAIGYKKAMFAYTWHSNYDKQFAGSQSPFDILDNRDADSMPNAHGAFGMIVSNRLPYIVVKGSFEAEKTIVVTNSTIVRDIHDQTASTSLGTGQSVVVMGWPDEQGRIIASFIRILPPR